MRNAQYLRATSMREIFSSHRGRGTVLIMIANVVLTFLASETYSYHQLSYYMDEGWLIPASMMLPSVGYLCFGFVANDLSVPRWFLAATCVPSVLPLLTSEEANELAACSIGIVAGLALMLVRPVTREIAQHTDVVEDSQSFSPSGPRIIDVDENVHISQSNKDVAPTPDRTPPTGKYVIAWVLSGLATTLVLAFVDAVLADSGLVVLDVEDDLAAFLFGWGVLGGIVSGLCSIFIYSFFQSLRLWKVFPWMVVLGFLGSLIFPAQYFLPGAMAEKIVTAASIGSGLGYILDLVVFAAYFELRGRPVLKEKRTYTLSSADGYWNNSR